MSAPFSCVHIFIVHASRDETTAGKQDCLGPGKNRQASVV